MFNGLAEQELWHRETDNIGSNINKYSIVEFVYKVTERIIADKYELITKGIKQANPLAPNMIRIELSKVYSTEKSVDTEEYVVLKEETLNEANLNEKKIYDEANMEEKDIIVTKMKYDVRGGN